MDTSRLLSVVNDVESEYDEGSLEELSTLIQQYTIARDNPNQDNSPAIQDALKELINTLNQGIFSEYPPSKQSILEAIGGHKRVGPGLMQWINDILSISGQTTAGIVTNLTEIKDDINKFQKACNQTKSGLQSLEIAPYKIEPGNFEAGVLIPEELVNCRLGELTKELNEWNTIVRGIQELAGEEEREVTVKSVSTGSYEVYLLLGVSAATILSNIIDKILGWYKQILEIRELRLKIQKLGAPIDETDSYAKYERKTLNDNIKNLTAELIKGASPQITPNRKHELETQIKVSIKQIARFVDKGGMVEVITDIPEEPEEPINPNEGENVTPEITQEYERLKGEYQRLKFEFDKLSTIRLKGSSLRLLPERTGPILQLTDGDQDNNEIIEPIEEEDKSKKKKSSS